LGILIDGIDVNVAAGPNTDRDGQVMRFENVFFDLDGTLTDPREGIVNCLQYAMQGLGLAAATESDLVRFIGPPLQDIFADLVGPGDTEMIEKGVTLYRERFSTRGLFENRVYGGIESLLKTLVAGGRSMYVVTSKPHIDARRIVRHFGLDSYFQGVYGPELDGTRKDKADLIAHLFRQESLSVDGTVMVGDRCYDVAGATANRLPTVGVLWGYGSQAELTRAGAWKVCRTPHDLLDVLLSGPKARDDAGTAKT
jgi:phosphoglycolate phosphatase